MNIIVSRLTSEKKWLIKTHIKKKNLQTLSIRKPPKKIPVYFSCRNADKTIFPKSRIISMAISDPLGTPISKLINKTTSPAKNNTV